MIDRISVIVPTYNRNDMLQRLLNSFSNLRCSVPLEFIIVDDCSDDGTVESIERWKTTAGVTDVICIRMSSRSGPARARNAGIAASTGSVIAFTDSDCVADPDWIDRLYQKISALPAEFAGVGGRVLPLNDDIYSRYNTIYRILEPQPHLRTLVGANCMFRKNPVVDVGMFDEYFDLPGGEESALCMKLWLKGYRFAFEDTAVVFHDYRRTLDAFISTFRNYGRGERTLFNKRPAEYLRFIEYPEKQNNAIAGYNNTYFTLVFIVGVMVFVVKQIPFLRKESLTVKQKCAILTLCLIHHVCYHLGRGTFSAALKKSVDIYLVENPGCLITHDANSPDGAFLEIFHVTINGIMKPDKKGKAAISVRNILPGHWVSGEFYISLFSPGTGHRFCPPEKPHRFLIPPLGDAVFPFRLSSPREEREECCHLSLVDSSGQTISNILEKTLIITADSHVADAQIVGTSLPSGMVQKESVPVWIRVRNTGKSDWSEDMRIRLGSKGNDLGTGALFGCSRVTLEPGQRIAPGDSVTFSFRITAPANPGRYLLQYQMVWENYSWFGATYEHRIIVEGRPVSDQSSRETK